MDLGIISIGKLKNGPLQELQNDYKKRILKLGKNIGINDLQIKEGLISKKKSADERKEEEGQFFEKNLNRESYNIILDETGEQINSLNISDLISNKLQDSRKIDFFIGGPDGFEKELLNQSDKLISFGKVTWPHMLLRVMLLEQLYRGITIIKNHPYHRN
jgi:23S rRNA (pseudouridine1915-N3)-methyltransferase|tara:strand:- start:2620 stop:3099 length:480 start_codon:yes stop_codon:yes gene_type:complete